MRVAQQAEDPNTGNTTQHTLPFEPRSAEYLKERAVDLARAAEAGLRSVSAGEGATLLGFDEPLSTGGLFIPYANAPGYARIRLSEGKTRFLVPRDREVPIYVPPGCELEGSAPIHVTEGPIKALALQQHGFNAIGLGGITTTLTKNNHELNDSWRVVALPRREVVILFDARRAVNPKVAWAEARLALALEQRGAKVKVAALPLREDGDDQGPDDFIAAHGDAELRKVVAAALPASPIERLKAIAVSFNTAEERMQAAMALLGDFPFLASIRERGISVEKQVVALLAKYKITPRDLGRAMKEMEEQAKEHTPEPVADSFGSPYIIHNGQWCFVSRLGDMVKHEPICNFTARILHEEVRDDGLEQERVFTVTGTTIGGEPLRPVTLTAAEFNDELWPMKKWGATAIVLPVRQAANHLRTAIQQQQPAPPSVMTYTHTGLRKHDGCWIFLHADGAVGAEDVTVQLDENLARYKLPETTDDLVEAVRLSIGTLRVADARITAALHAAMYRAPLQELDYCDAAVAVHGPSGSLKSSVTALFLSHYGDFKHDNLPLSWIGTENAIEAHLHKTKDMPVVIDDFVPKSADHGDEFHKKAMRVLRSTGNGTGRQRLNRNLSLRPSRRPRALVITTGEQLPEGGSIRARLVTIRMRREDVDLAQLSRLQQARRRLPHALRGYIEWLLPRLESIRAEVTEVHAKYWASLQQEGGAHLRAPTAMAHLLVGAHYFAEFAVSIGAIDQAGADDYLRTVREALVANNREQSRLAAEMKPTRRFLDVVKALLLQGKVGLVPTALPLATTTEDDGTTNIGWEDHKLVYLMPDAVYAAFMQALRAMNESMPLGQSALWSQLQDEGLATRGDGKNLLPKRRLGGARPRVVEIRRSLLHDPTEIEERIGAEVDGGSTNPDDDDDPDGGPEGAGPAGGAPPFEADGGRPGPVPQTPNGAGSLAASPVSLRLSPPALLARPWPYPGPTEGTERSPSSSGTYAGWPYWPDLPESTQGAPSQPDQGADAIFPSMGVLSRSGAVGPGRPPRATAGSDTGIAARASRAASGQQSGQGTASFAAFVQAARQAGRVGMTVRYAGSSDLKRLALLALAAPGGMTCVVDPAEFSPLGPLAEFLREVTVVGHDIKTPLVHLAQHLGTEPQAVIDTLLLWKLRDLGEHLDDPKHFTFDRARAEAGCSSNDNARAIPAAQIAHRRALEEARDVLLIADRLKTEAHECDLEEVAELEMRLLPVASSSPPTPPGRA